MIPFVLLAQVPYVARDASLAWSFPGTVTVTKGRYALVGKGLRGEVAWFSSPTGRFDAETLYAQDTARTKDADAARSFTHVRAATTFALMPAIVSDQRYVWNGSAVASRCVYCAAGNRAWVVRLWWPKDGPGEAVATAFLKTVKRLP